MTSSTASTTAPTARRTNLRSAVLLLVAGGLPFAGALSQQRDVHPIVLPRAASAAPVATIDIASPLLTHVQVGHLILLDAKTRVTRIYVADPAVLDSYVASPRQIVLTGKAAGVTSLVIWDAADIAQTYTISVDISIDELRRALRQSLPTEKVSADSSEGKVVLTGSLSTRGAADEAVKLANVFSKDVVDSMVVNSAEAKQVRLQVRFVEIDRARANQFGINISAPGGGRAVGSGSTSQFPSTASLSGASSGGSGFQVGGNTLTFSNALNFLFYSSKLGIGLSVQDLESRQIAQILAEPTITTISGQSASFLAGGEFPFPVVQGSSGGTTSITIQFRPYGVKLDFTPKVNVDGTIELKVTPEVSSLDYANAVTISGYTIPAISTKHADTQVVLRSGQSFAISGLLDKQTTDSLSRTPGLANIPILGALFKSKGINLSTSELIVIVTPTIVDPLTDTSTPGEPALVRPMLDQQKFDESIPAVHANTNGKQ